MNNLYSEYSLSAINAVEFDYHFNVSEKLDRTLYSYDNGFNHYTHKAFDNFRDACLSRRNCLVLTDKIPIKQVFKKDSESIYIGKISGSCFLKIEDLFLTVRNNNIYVGGTGERLRVTLAPISSNIVQLKPSKNSYIEIDKHYPFTARITEETLSENEKHRQLFEVDYKQNKICFKTKTEEGYRFLSYGTDRVLRGVGLTLNETVINSYLFTPEFITAEHIDYNFNAVTTEVRYYNDLLIPDNRATVKIQEKEEVDTHLLITASSTEIAKNYKADANISITKTNFSSSGTYLNKKQHE